MAQGDLKFGFGTVPFNVGFGTVLLNLVSETVSFLICFFCRDGCDDIAVGAPGEGVGSGAVFIFRKPVFK